MTKKSSTRADGRGLNQNETLVRDGQSAHLKVKTSVKAGPVYYKTAEVFLYSR